MTKPIKNLQLFNDLCAVEETLKERGWCKGAAIERDGRVCVLGAAGVATGAMEENYGSLSPNDRFNAIVSALNSLMPGYNELPWTTFDITAYNDHPGTTLDDVLAKLREARERCCEGRTGGLDRVGVSAVRGERGRVLSC